MLDDTLVIWGGEFGRTVYSQGKLTEDNYGRDPVSVFDFNATLLHCLGLDHTRLTYKYQGRDFRLTDVHGEVVKALLK